MNRNILNKEVQAFIREHQNEDITRIALQKSPFPDVTSAELATQIDSRRRSQKKLPDWYNTPGIYFPPKLNLEQASSQQTALYKSGIVKGGVLADLTGGFGVDTFFFSKQAEKVYHIEQNEELSEIAEYDLHILGSENISFIRSDSIRFLQDTELNFGTIYIDPARRVEARKVFLLKDTEPDVTLILPLMLQKASRILIKTSPLYDIQSGLKELTNVSEVHVVSVKNDCKELLWVIDRGFEEVPLIKCSTINGEETQTFSFTYRDEKKILLNEFSRPLIYLYEPDVALLKAGAYKSITVAYKLIKLHSNTHLYTSNELNSIFPGRVFRVVKTDDYASFSRESKGANKANIISRNFPLTVDQLKKKHRLADGGDKYLFFTTDPKGKLIVIEADRLH